MASVKEATAVERAEMPLGRFTLSIETGRMAKQADGAVVVRLGDTVILATAVAQREPRPGVDFLPLTVDYRENTYAGGKIPGGFFKREGRPNEKEILTSRMIDRPLRPLFPEGYSNETQVVGLLLSADMENDSDTLAIIGASTALYISDIPFDSPIGAVRVGYWDGQYVVNPTSTELRTKSKLNLLVAGTDEGIVMVESAAAEISEAEMVQALSEAHQVIKKIVALQRDLRARVGKPKRQVAKKEIDPAFAAQVEAALAGPLLEAMRMPGKIASYARIKQIKDEYVANLQEADLEKKGMVSAVYDALREKTLRREILENNRRNDGRRFDEIRNITSEVGVLPRTHGSALFTRGETQALVTVTLGTSEDMQIIDTVQEPDHKKRFMLHYNFPPFSVGEVKFLRGPGRREIGHGALAEKSLRDMLPDEDDVPLHRPHRLRHPGEQRLLVHGLDLRRHPGPHGRGRAPEEPGGRRGHGPGQGRRPLRRAERHRGRGRPLRRHGLQGRGHARGHHRAADGHQDRRHHRRDPGQGPGAGAGRAGSTSWTAWPRPCPSRGPASAPTPRASSPSGSPWTRSATSSGPAAR